MKNRSLALITAVIFLFVSCACSHAPKKTLLASTPEGVSDSPEPTLLASRLKNEESWWKKDEHQWAVMFLIILGLAIATSASFWLYYSSGGLTMYIHK